MPKRSTRAERLRYYHYCVVRDGELCQDCGRVPPELEAPLEVDHIDEDKDNWDPINLQLLCKPCNVKKSRRIRSRNGASPRSAGGTGAEAWQDMPEHPLSASPQSADGTRPEAWEKGGESDFIYNDLRRRYVRHPRAIKEGLGATDGTPQQRVNLYAEPLAADWILEQVRVYGVVLKQDLANGSAQISHTSPSTTRTYIDKLSSSEGPLVETKNELGERVIAFRDSQVPMSGDAGEEGPQARMPLDDEDTEVTASGRTESSGPRGLLGWLRGRTSHGSGGNES